MSTTTPGTPGPTAVTSATDDPALELLELPSEALLELPDDAVAAAPPAAADAPAKPKRKRFGEMLVEAGLLDAVPARQGAHAPARPRRAPGLGARCSCRWASSRRRTWSPS